MNQLTLNFKIKKLEKEFYVWRKELFQPIIYYQKWIAFIIILVESVYSLIQQNWIIASILWVSTIIILITIRLNNKFPVVYEIFIIILIIGSHVNLTLVKYLTSEEVNLSFSEGFFLALATVSALHIFGFFERMLLTASILVLHLIFKDYDNEENILYYVRLSLLPLMYFQYCYGLEKKSRLNFIDVFQNQQLLNKYNKFNDVHTFIIRYDERKSLILLEKDNNKKVTKDDQEQFIELIDKMHLQFTRSKNKITELIQIESALSPHRQTLKQVLINFTLEQVNETKVDTPLATQQADLYLYGFHEQQVYQISIFQSYNLIPITTLLIKESRSETKEEELRLRIKNNTKQFDYLKKIFETNIRQCLIYFKWIQNFSNKQQDITLINRLLKTMHYSLIKSYTDFQNLDNFMQQEIQNIRTVHFNIEELIKETAKICDGYFKSRADSLANMSFFEIQCRLSNCIMYSEYKYIKLLMFNLLFYTGSKSQTVIVELDEVKSEMMESPIIKVAITFQSPTKTRQQLINLPILNPQTLQELKHNSVVPIELNLPIALMLIRKLGPFDKIKLIQHKRKQNYLEFYLFQNIQQDFLLIPIISLKPSDKITNTTQSRLINSFSSFFKFDSVKETQRFD